MRFEFHGISVPAPNSGAGVLVGPDLRFEGPFRLNCEADRNVGGTVELFQHLVAKQAAVLALDAGPGRQLDAAIAGMTGGTGKI